MRVLNKRTATYDEKANAVYVGRPSKWGNPFVIGSDGTRREVITKYEAWLMRRPELMAALPELSGKDLMCWCSPCECHADVLIKLANSTDGA